MKKKKKKLNEHHFNLLKCLESIERTPNAETCILTNRKDGTCPEFFPQKFTFYLQIWKRVNFWHWSNSLRFLVTVTYIIQQLNIEGIIVIIFALGKGKGHTYHLCTLVWSNRSRSKDLHFELVWDPRPEVNQQKNSIDMAYQPLAS